MTFGRRIFFNGKVRLAAVCAAALAISQACTDVPTAAENPGRPSVPSGISATISDPGLNYNDTWVSTTTTVADTTILTSDQPFTDPATDQQTTSMNIGSPPTNVEVLAGYGYSGELRVTNSYATENPSETQIVQQIGNSTGDADQQGVASSDPLDVEPIADLGTLQDAQVNPSPPSDPSCPTSETAGCVTPGQTRMIPDKASISIVRQDASRLITLETVKIPLRPGSATPQMAAKFAAVDNIGQQLSKHESKVTREYEKRGSRWLLKHVLNEETANGPHSKILHRQHFNFIRLESFQNPVLDAARSARRATIDTTALLSRSGRSIITPQVNASGREIRFALSSCNPEDDPTCCPEYADYCSPPPDGGGGGGGGAYGNSPTFPDPPTLSQAEVPFGEFAADVSSDQTTIVLQHGYRSSARTFLRMENWIASHMTVGSVIPTTTNWTHTYEDQAAELQASLRTTHSGYMRPRVILVGHSNGGMISRYLGRHPGASNERGGSPYYEPVSVNGVITIGTPHWGASMIRYPGDLNVLLGTSGVIARFLCWFEPGGGCRQVTAIESSEVPRLFVAMATPQPVHTEMYPRSSYHTQFNTQPESFPRYGIQSYNWKRWQLWRVWGEFYCYSNEPCGGPKMVKKADRTYHHDVSCSIIALFIGRWRNAAGCAADGAFMLGFDNIYRRFVEPHALENDDYGDGIVPGWSQRYPNIPDEDQYPVHDGPSHVGETTHPRIAAKVETILNRRLQIPRTNFVLGE